MPAPAIEIHGLAKTFGKGKDQVRAVRGVDVDVDRGQVFGFLGPNGAGKSTSIRMIMDLVRPTAGTIRIFGREVPGNADALARVGALVEGAAFYGPLTGRRNLEVLARTRGVHDADEIESLLDRVGMADRADRPVGGYSMGMKQRLGVAGALLGRPDLVILDEPTNGLDPAGIHEMRRFIRDLVDRDGLTVFLSSHLLSEVEQTCDRVAIIQDGEIVRQGTIDALLDQDVKARLRVAPTDRAVRVLAGRWPLQQVGDQLTVEVTPEAVPEVVRALVAADVDVFEVRNERPSLEDLFLDLTGRRGREGDD